MKILVKDPVTDGKIEMDAQREDYNGEAAWRILSPGKDSFVMVERGGEWTVVDEEDFNPELAKLIGKSLHPVARYNSLT